ncbi:uncharacterized protein B0H18DRAFT_1107254 [Fomitopsis serialis]|uniref:uncharacterized protein n=1 Tax=Fomitopsis serialis TaxID=139415 RepID=UPI00200787C4|nr:uncharacterized protein B0H18DRAFT_1107254 [Neoantrodia serialis]KAH9917509.1 hypothetical protein B0H18DRAFT_1107254 [Neoantrodia serialis]
MSPTNWPRSVETKHDQEMTHIRRLGAELLDHELEAHHHPFLQSSLDWAGLRTSANGPSGYRIKSVAQFLMSIPPDAFDVPDITDRRTRSMAPVVGLGYESISGFSAASTQSAISTHASAATTGTERRDRDRRRTPDYATLLTPNDPSKPWQRLLFIHELKPYGDRFQRPGEPTRLVDPADLDMAFSDMRAQVSEQAQLALWTFKEHTFVYVMCHIGIHFMVIKYGRKKAHRGAPSGSAVTALYKSKVYMLLNEEHTDFSIEFKRWWTTAKNSACGGLQLRKERPQRQNAANSSATVDGDGGIAAAGGGDNPVQV